MEQRPTGMWKGLSGRHLEEGVQAKVQSVPYRDERTQTVSMAGTERAEGGPELQGLTLMSSSDF